MEPQLQSEEVDDLQLRFSRLSLKSTEHIPRPPTPTFPEIGPHSSPRARVEGVSSPRDEDFEAGMEAGSTKSQWAMSPPLRNAKGKTGHTSCTRGLREVIPRCNNCLPRRRALDKRLQENKKLAQAMRNRSLSGGDPSPEESLVKAILVSRALCMLGYIQLTIPL